MTFENALKQLPTDTRLTEFKQIEQLVPRETLKRIANVCLESTYKTLYELFIDFLTIGYYMGDLCIREIKSTINNVTVGREHKRLYELGIY